MNTLTEIFPASLKRVFKEASKNSITIQEIDIDRYAKLYARYFGLGNFLYVLANSHEDEIKSIANQRIHPKKMTEQISQHTADFRIVKIDAEMGGVSVFKPAI